MENTNTQEEKTTSRSIGIRFGLYNALVGILLFAIAAVLNQNPFSSIWNWAGAVIGIGLVVYAHIQYKKTNADGFMNYGEGVGIAFWIGLISTLITVPVMFIYLNYVDAGPMEVMYQEQEDKMIAQGLPQEAIDMGLEWTKKLFWPMACLGGIIGSTVTGLIVSIFTKKSRPEMPM